jgi:hypothetical protein
MHELGMGEMSEHRVPMLGATWRRLEDPALSRDPRVRSLVSALAALPSPEPRAEFRAELRAQLVAIAPRIVGETTAPTVPLPVLKAAGKPATEGHRPRHADGAFARLRTIPIGRGFRIALAVVATFAVLLGGAVWMSKKALPGDALYGLKRASETVQLDTAGSDTAKARDLLNFAATRADEVKGLLSRAGMSGAQAQASGLDPHTASLIKSTLSSADSDVKSASSLLATQAVRKKTTNPLQVLTKWAPSQLTRLNSIAAAMPSPTLRERTESSADLVSAAVTRAQQLAPNVSSGCANKSTDALGPLPQCGITSVIPSIVGGQPSTGTTGAASTAGNSAPGGNGGPVSIVPNTSTTGAQPTGSASSNPGLHLPSLIPPSPSLPLTVSSCGIAASLGPIGIGIGLCSGIHLSLHP